MINQNEDQRKEFGLGRDRYPKIYEDNCIVLDFLPHGHAGHQSRMPVGQVVGINHFTLLEVVPKKGVFLEPHERIYIGPDKREKIHHILGKINYDKLTQTAKLELESIIKDSVKKQFNKIIEFFNKSGPLSTRLHQLELIPGIGKKHMWKILGERQSKPFTDLDDLKQRVPLIPDPEKAVIKRVIEELEEKDKYKLLIGRISILDSNDKVN